MKDALYISRFLIVFNTLFVLAFVGCKSVSSPPSGPNGRFDAGGISANIGVGQETIAKAFPHADPVGQALLGIATGVLQLAQDGAGHLKDLENWYVGNYWKNTNELNALKVKHATAIGEKDTEIAVVKADTWYRAHQYWRYVVIGWLASMAVGIVLFLWFGSGSIVGRIGVKIISVLLLGHGKGVLGWLGYVI